jgi:hypothetical protein
MRRTVPALVLATACFATAACSFAPADPPRAGTVVSSADAATRTSCEAVGEVYNRNLAPFAEAVTKAAGGAEASRAEAQKSLKAFATALRGATATSDDARLRADGAQAADRLQAKAADKAYFSRIKTPQDVGTVLGSDLSSWLSPVKSHCS